MRLWDFLTLQGPLVKVALLGVCLLAMNCALLGTFLVSRRMAMTSDTLSHAVLPGIMGGYLWNLTRDPLHLLVGAVLSGLLGTWLLSAITSTTKLRADAAQGIVLSLFLGLGVCLLKLLKTLPTAQGNLSGLDQFLFGQMAGLEGQDVTILAGALALTLVTVVLGYRSLLVLSFDRGYGIARGLPMRLTHAWFMFLTTVAIVVSMETVGVVLISALMVIPVSAASLLTQKLPRQLLLASCFGVLAAILGSGASYCFEKVAAGPSVVLAASGLFCLAFLFSPKHGSLARWWHGLRWNRLVEAENLLKEAFRWLEDKGLQKHDLIQVADFPKKGLTRLQNYGFAHQPQGGQTFQLTELGQTRACELVRAHRLWELYLTQRASYASDHVHADAEEIEHMLTSENLERIAQVLGNPTHDPHGKPIP